MGLNNLRIFSVSLLTHKSQQTGKLKQPELNGRHDYFVILFALVVPGNPYRCAVCWVFYLPAFEGKLPTLSNKKPPAIAEGFRDPVRIQT